MMSILFGLMVALAVIFIPLATLAVRDRDKKVGFICLLIASICTGIAAGMAYGGGV